MNTTGAGDVFVGGLLYQLSVSEHWQSNDAIAQAIHLAHGCGALATKQKCAMTALPDLAVLQHFLSE